MLNENDNDKNSNEVYDFNIFNIKTPTITNLALNKKVLSSSNEPNNLTANFATDGNKNTVWSSGNFSTGEQWIYVDLGEIIEFDTIKIYWGKAYATIYRIEIFDNTAKWNSIYRTTTGVGSLETINLSSKQNARYVNIFCEKNNINSKNNVSIYEIEIYNVGNLITTPTISSNLALNKKVISSSNETNSLTANFVTDGNKNTRWSSGNFSTGKQWIYVDLGAITEFDSIRIYWERANAPIYRIETSNNATNWTSIYRTINGTGGIETINLNSKENARYIRVYCEKNNSAVWSSVSIYEIEIYNNTVTSSISNIITISNIINIPSILIGFDTTNKKLKASSFATGIDSNNNYDYVKIKLYNLWDSTLSIPTFKVILSFNEDIKNFVDYVNSISFEYNQILEITCENRALNKVTISDFQNKNKTYTLTKNIEYFQITKAGLVLFTPQSILENNKITIRSYNNLYVSALTITFDPNSMLIKATAIAEPINKSNASGGITAFQYKFKDINGEIIKTGYVRPLDSWIAWSDGLAVTLANSLNNTPFAYGQSIELYAPVKDYFSIGKTYMSISNVPFKTNEYWKFNDTETVTITPLGLVLQSDSPLGNAQLLPNIIIINGYTGKSTVQIYFDANSKKFLVSTSSFDIGKLSQTGDMDYFIITLNDSSGNEKAIARIKENSRAAEFTEALNNYSFEYGDTINIQAIDLSKIVIKNYPNYKSEYSPLLKDEKFTITKLGLVSSLETLKNEIKFLGLDNNLIVTINFNTKSKKLFVNSTGIEAHSGFGNNEYFAITLKDNFGGVVKEASVKGNENANNFATILNGANFQYNYSINIRFKEKDRVLISNHPNNGDIYKSPNNAPKTFIITKDGLMTLLLKNSITFLGYGNNLIASLEFNFVSKQLVAYSTGTEAHYVFGNNEYFAIILKDNFGKVIKEASVKGNENANNFASALNGIYFQYGYTINIRFKEKDRFLVSNYPKYGETYKSPDDSPKTFIINESGLIYN